MNRKATLIALLSFFTITCFSQSLTTSSGMIPLYDSITYYRYNITTGSLKLDAMDKNFVYDDHGNKLSSEYYKYYDHWLFNNFSNFSYNADQKLTRSIVFKPYSLDTIRDVIYEYDHKGNRTLYVKREVFENEFCIVQRESYTYDNNNNVLERVIELRDYEDTLIFVTKEVHSYLDNKLNVKYGYQWYNGTWTDKWKYTYSYSDDGKLLEMYIFIFESGNWVEKYKSSYTYDNAGLNLVYSETYELISGVYFMQYCIRQVFDIDNIMTSRVKYAFSCDVFPQPVVSGDSTIYTFRKVLGDDKMEIPPAHLSIYPNPTSGVVTIDSSTPVHSTEVYSLNGEHLFTVPGKSKLIDLSSNPAGIYLMKVITDDDVFVRKVVVR